MKKSNVLLSLFCSFGLMSSCLELNAADPNAVAVDQSDPSAGGANHKKKHVKHKSSAAKARAKARHSAKRAAKKQRHQHASVVQDAAADPSAAGN